LIREDTPSNPFGLVMLGARQYRASARHHRTLLVSDCWTSHGHTGKGTEGCRSALHGIAGRYTHQVLWELARRRLPDKRDHCREEVSAAD